MSAREKGFFEFDESRTEYMYLLRLYYKGYEIGRADCLVDDNEMVLADIKVEDQFAAHPENLVHSIWQKFFKPKPISFRKQGWGSKMLKMVIVEAKRQELSQVTGSVVPDDRATNPKLLEWYQKHGFRVVGPDKDNPTWLWISLSL